MAKDRLILFGDSHLHISRALIDAALRAAQALPALRVVAICDTSRKEPPSYARQTARLLAASAALLLFNPGDRPVAHPSQFRNVRRSARRHRVPVLVPPGRTLSHPGFPAWLRAEFKPTLALSLACCQIFEPELLDLFSCAVNYHNGLLPGYRGVFSTAWSIYNGESHSGYTFHRMTPEVDAGPVLFEDRLPVSAADSTRSLEIRKTHLAHARLPEVLRAMLDRHPGIPQSGSPRLFTLQQVHEMRRVDDPGQFTWAELQRRQRAFTLLRLRLNGTVWPVTRFQAAARSSGAAGRLGFTTSDGLRVRPTRFLHLPLPLYRGWRGLSGATAVCS
jgi:methionyl-tRNA formyltransferase